MNFTDSNQDNRVFFKCDTIEWIVEDSVSRELNLKDFKHIYGKHLYCTLRNSMAIAVLKRNVRVKQRIAYSI